MATYKLVTLKDPVTGEYLVPRRWGNLGYDVVDGEIVPPFELDADTLGGYHATDFAKLTDIDGMVTASIDVTYNGGES